MRLRAGPLRAARHRRQVRAAAACVPRHRAVRAHASLRGDRDAREATRGETCGPQRVAVRREEVAHIRHLENVLTHQKLGNPRDISWEAILAAVLKRSPPCIVPPASAASALRARRPAGARRGHGRAAGRPPRLRPCVAWRCLPANRRGGGGQRPGRRALGGGAGRGVRGCGAGGRVRGAAARHCFCNGVCWVYHSGAAGAAPDTAARRAPRAQLWAQPARGRRRGANAAHRADGGRFVREVRSSDTAQRCATPGAPRGAQSPRLARTRRVPRLRGACADAARGAAAAWTSSRFSCLLERM